MVLIVVVARRDAPAGCWWFSSRSSYRNDSSDWEWCAADCDADRIDKRATALL